MRLEYWLRGLRTGISTSLKSTSPKRRILPNGGTVGLEKLEDRLLLSYQSTLVAGAVRLTENVAAADSLTLSRNVNGYLAHNLPILPAGNNGPGFASAIDFNTAVAGDQSILVANVTSIVVKGGAGNDTILINTLNLPRATVVELDGEAGDDTVGLLGNLTVGAPVPTAVNDRFSLNGTGVSTIGGGISGGVLGNDVNPGSLPLQATLVGSGQSPNGTLVLALDGTFTYTPNGGFTGTDTFTYRATTSDGTNQSSDAIIDIVVNSQSIQPAANDDYYQIDVNASLTATGINGVLANDTADQTLKPLTANLATGQLQTGPLFGTLTAFDPATGAFTYVPNANFTGTDTFTYSASASNGLAQSNMATATITVVDPYSLKITAETINLGQVAPADQAAPIAITTRNGQQYNGNVFLVQNAVLTSDNTKPIEFHGQVDSYRPQFRFPDPYNFKPVATNAAHRPEVDDGFAFVFEALTATDVNSGDSQTFAIRDQPNPGVVSLVSAVNFDFASSQVVRDSFTFTVSDGSLTSDPGTIVILDPAASNQAPLAANQFLFATTDPTSGTLRADDLESNPLQFRIAQQPVNGALSNFDAATGAFVYTPNAGFVGGYDTFTFVANDGTSDSNLATVTIYVSPLRSLTVNTAGNTDFGDGGADYVGSNYRLLSMTTDAPGLTRFNITPSTDAIPSVRTAANQIYNDDVILRHNTVLTTNNAGNVEFHKTVNSFDTNFRSLTVNTAGNTAFGDGDADYVGNNNRLLSLTTDAAGFTRFNITPSADATPSVRTDGSQIYNDDVVLRQNTALTTNNAGNVEFHKTVNSFTDPEAVNNPFRSLTVNTAGNTDFGDGGADYVGNTNRLLSLTTDAAGFTRFNITPSADATPSVRTDANQIYNDDVVLRQDTVLTTSNAGNVEFHKTVNSFTDPELVISPFRSLTVNTSGNTDFGDGGADYVGNTNRLLSLTTDAAGFTRFNITPSADTTPSIRTDANQIYNDDVILRQNTVLTTNNAGNVEFHKTVNSFTDPELVNSPFRSLAVNTAGNTDFGDGGADYVGNTNRLLSLTTDAPGFTRFNITPSADATPSVRTDANQIYNDDVILHLNTVLTTNNAGNVEFHKTVDSFDLNFRSLAVNTAGNTDFGDGGADYVGNNNRLLSLTTDAAGFTRININPSTDATPSVRTDANQVYHDDVVLRHNTVLTSNNAGSVEFHKTVNSFDLNFRSLAVNTAGNTAFGDGDADYVGNTNRLLSLTTDVDGFTRFNITPSSDAVPSVRTDVNQIYNDDVVLHQNPVLTTNNAGDVEFHKTVNSFDTNFRSLAVNTAGNTDFGDGGGDYVGNVNRLLSLTTDAPGFTRFNILNPDPVNNPTPSVRTENDQVFGDAVRLRQDTRLTSEVDSSNITFGGTVDSFDDNFHALTLIAGQDGLITFRGDVGVFKPLGSTADAAMTIRRGQEVRFQANARDVRLSGALRIETPNLKMYGDGSPVTKITGVRDRQNVIEITVNGTELHELQITRGGTPTDGDGVVVQSATPGTTLRDTKLHDLQIFENYRNGVLLVDASNSSINDNTIRNNGNSQLEDDATAAGVRIQNSDPNQFRSISNSILNNAIYDNGLKNLGVGIDLVGGTQLATGMTLNDKGANPDADRGPNNLQNYPEISYIYIQGDALQVYYSVPTLDEPGNYSTGVDPLNPSDKVMRIQFFLSNDFNVNPHDDWREGRRFLIERYYPANKAGETQVTTIPLSLLPAELQDPARILTDRPVRIVATATTSDANTSEFSRAAAVNARPGLDTGGATPGTNNVPSVDAATDLLGQAGFLFAPGPKSPVAGEVPALEFHWATDGDNDQDIRNQNPATFFNDELGVYSLQNASGDVVVNQNGVPSTVPIAANNENYIRAVDTATKSWDQTNGVLSNVPKVTNGVIRSSIFGYLTERIDATVATGLTFRFVVQSDYFTAGNGTEAEQVKRLLMGPNVNPAPENAYGDTVILVTQEEMRLKDVTVTPVPQNGALVEFTSDGVIYYQFDVTASVDRAYNNTLASAHFGNKPVAATNPNPFGHPKGGAYALLVTGTSEVSVVDRNETNQNQIGFYLVQDGSYGDLLTNNATNRPLDPNANGSTPNFEDAPQAFFSINTANTDARNHFRTIFGADPINARNNYGVLKFYWSDAFNLGSFGTTLGDPASSGPPRGIKDAVVTVVDPFVQPIKGPGSVADLAKAMSPAYVAATGNGTGGTTSASTKLDLTISKATLVNSVGEATGTVSRTSTTSAVTITLTPNRNSRIKIGNQTFGPNLPVTITLAVGQASANFTVTDITKSTKVTASGSGLKSKSKTISAPKGRSR